MNSLERPISTRRPFNVDISRALTFLALVENLRLIAIPAFIEKVIGLNLWYLLVALLLTLDAVGAVECPFLLLNALGAYAAPLSVLTLFLG